MHFRSLSLTPTLPLSLSLTHTRAHLQPASLLTAAQLSRCSLCPDVAVHYHYDLAISPVKDRYIPIPGASIVIEGVTAALDLVATLDGNQSNLFLDLGVDACIGALGHQECGAKISSDFPLWIIQGVLNATEACNEPIPPPTPIPTLPPPTPAETASCLSCINHKNIIGHDKDWCWVDKTCHDTGSVVNPCFPSTCASKCSLSHCTADLNCLVA